MRDYTNYREYLNAAAMGQRGIRYVTTVGTVVKETARRPILDNAFNNDHFGGASAYGKWHGSVQPTWA